MDYAAKAMTSTSSKMIEQRADERMSDLLADHFIAEWKRTHEKGESSQKPQLKGKPSILIMRQVYLPSFAFASTPDTNLW